MAPMSRISRWSRASRGKRSRGRRHECRRVHCRRSRRDRGGVGALPRQARLLRVARSHLPCSSRVDRDSARARGGRAGAGRVRRPPEMAPVWRAGRCRRRTHNRRSAAALPVPARSNRCRSVHRGDRPGWLGGETPARQKGHGRGRERSRDGPGTVPGRSRNVHAAVSGLRVPPVTVVSTDGTVPSLAALDSETWLDIQAAAATAPGSTNVVYFCAGTDPGMATAISAAVQDQEEQAECDLDQPCTAREWG